MTSDESFVLTTADIVRDSVVMNDVALASDFDEARFRAQLIVGKADAVGLLDVVLAAAQVLDRLGPVGTKPQTGYGDPMLWVATELKKSDSRPCKPPT
jgi:hypothetical protein